MQNFSIPAKAVPSSSLALPEFATELSEVDDRIVQLSRILHQTLTENLALHKPQDGGTSLLEIEAKLGQINMNQHDPAFKEYLQSPSWSICLPQKLPDTNKSLYNFKSGILGDQILTDATIFSAV